MNIIKLHKHKLHSINEIATQYYYKPLYKNAGFLRFDCQILDGQRVVNKLKLCGSRFIIFASTWLWQIKKKIHFKTSRDVSKNIETFMTKVIPHNESGE